MRSEISEKHIDKRKIAKLITKIENDVFFVNRSLYKKNENHSYRIGITGPPGAGKSTITNELTKLFVEKGFSVGIIAIDPTSPFSGGALLGDRVRMNNIGLHPSVYIRSMATRGSLGGLSNSADAAADVLESEGIEIIIFETVGVGQSELDIVNSADTTIVVLVPESGDSIQAMKAGLMEIADIFVLNKCDRPASELTYSSIESVLHFKDRLNDWIPEIIKTTAIENLGIQELLNKIIAHKNYLIDSNKFDSNRKIRLKNKITRIVSEQLNQDFFSEPRLELLETIITKVIESDISEFDALEKIKL